MSSKNTYEVFREKLKQDKIVCTQSELDEYIMYGLLFNSGSNYITRDRKSVKIELIKQTFLTFDIDFNETISKCHAIAKENDFKHIYCMSERCYNQYKSQGRIISKDNKEFYRLFDKDLWLVHII